MLAETIRGSTVATCLTVVNLASWQPWQSENYGAQDNQAHRGDLIDHGDARDRGVRAAVVTCPVAVTRGTWERYASVSSFFKVRFGQVSLG